MPELASFLLVLIALNFLANEYCELSESNWTTEMLRSFGITLNWTKFAITRERIFWLVPFWWLMLVQTKNHSHISFPLYSVNWLYEWPIANSRIIHYYHHRRHNTQLECSMKINKLCMIGSNDAAAIIATKHYCARFILFFGPFLAVIAF